VTAWRNTLPFGETETLHGYTLTSLNRITRYAVLRGYLRASGTIADQLETAWHTIVETLCEADEAPTAGQLINAARAALSAAYRDELHHHGYVQTDVASGREAMPAFQRYWNSPAGSALEDRVVERTALAQIWDQLNPSERQALEALAATGDYQKAAAAVGKKQGTFNVLIRNGRMRFLAAWHEGETPSKVWRTDRRVGSRNGTDTRGRTRLTVSQVEAYRDRRERGETIRALAAEAGVSECTLGALLAGKYRPAPDVAVAA
jgi:DNA-binding XRE family transcriptional regulator